MKTCELIPVLINKFNIISIDSKLPACNIYEHFTNSGMVWFLFCYIFKERILGPEEYPLLVQLNWSKIGHDGKFLFKVKQCIEVSLTFPHLFQMFRLVKKIAQMVLMINYHTKLTNAISKNKRKLSKPAVDWSRCYVGETLTQKIAKHLVVVLLSAKTILNSHTYPMKWTWGRKADANHHPTAASRKWFQTGKLPCNKHDSICSNLS